MLIQCFIVSRFILSLFYPVLQVLLLVMIDSARKDTDKVIRIGSQNIKQKKKWKIKETTWIRVARLWLPISFILCAIAIVVPGMVYTLTA